MSAETNIPSYWLNWRFFVCAIFILTSLFLSSFLIWRYEGPRKSKKRDDDDQSQELEQLTGSVVFDDETWNTCVKDIHPNWLLGFRVFGFLVLLGLISGNAIADGTGIFIFYTQWTFTLVTVYFGLAALVSIYRFKSADNGENGVSRVDEEQGSYRPPVNGENSNVFKSSNGHDRNDRSTREVANTLGYIHQILFQTCAGAVLLTDGVFWFIIYPFLTSKDFSLDFFIVIMHSVNAIFLLGETFLNSLVCFCTYSQHQKDDDRYNGDGYSDDDFDDDFQCIQRFPLFRIAYFVVWTGIFVLFQWIVHACVSFWWPYPFLDLSSPYAPLWYAAVGLMHVPCFGIFALIVKLKYLWVSRCFSDGQ